MVVCLFFNGVSDLCQSSLRPFGTRSFSVQAIFACIRTCNFIFVQPFQILRHDLTLLFSFCFPQEKISEKRRHQDSYLYFGFSFLIQNGEQVPQCLICLKTLANGSMKPFQLKQHLENSHPEFKDKDRAFFKLKEANL